MFDGIIEAAKEGWNRGCERYENEQAAKKEAEERQAQEAEQRAQRQAQINALTGGKLSNSALGGAGYVGDHLLETFGSANLDQVFNTWAPHLTNAIYGMYSNLYSQAQQATAWKAKCEELEKRCADLEKRCTEQSQVIETFTKDRSKSNSFSR